MKKMILSFVVLGGLVLGLKSQAAETAAPGLMLPSVRVSPCRYWSMNRDGGYVCNSYEYSVEITDSFALDSTLRGYEQRLQALEKRLTESEARCQK